MAAAGRRGERGQFLHLRGIERIVAGGIDQHRRRLSAGASARGRGSTGWHGDDRLIPSSLVKAASCSVAPARLPSAVITIGVTPAITRRVARRATVECLAGPGRADQQQRLARPAAACRTGSPRRGRSRGRPAAGRARPAGGDAMEVERCEAWRDRPGTAAAVVLRLQRGSDLDAAADAARGEDQGVLAQFGPHRAIASAIARCAVELQAHGVTGAGSFISSPPSGSAPAGGFPPVPAPACSAGCARRSPARGCGCRPRSAAPAPLRHQPPHRTRCAASA